MSAGTGRFLFRNNQTKNLCGVFAIMTVGKEESSFLDWGCTATTVVYTSHEGASRLGWKVGCCLGTMGKHCMTILLALLGGVSFGTLRCIAVH